MKMIDSKYMHGKINSQPTYSVNSILDKSDNDSAIDLSIKQSQTKDDFDIDSKSNSIISNSQNVDKINHMLLNLIHQRDFQINKRLQPLSTNGQPCHTEFDKNSKLPNTPPNIPWNFLRSVHNIPATGNNIFNQFQNIIFNKRPSNPSIIPPSTLYQRPNFKNMFPQQNPIAVSENSNNYFQNLSQIFNSRLSVTQNIDNSQYLNMASNNLSSKFFSTSNIDMSPHFHLQNILKSTSNRKRKRTKVTDTRLPRRTITHQSYSTFPHITDHSVNELPRFPTFIHSPSNSSQSSHSEEPHGDPKKYTLTPIHLRKAKLMFLYTRYPNSQMLKSYFPDITFCKQNTAQLVKWFSNFREFYYSEMEKAVQRALSNGTQYAKDIDVTVDSELFKNLMTHFNKKKQIVVPCEFLTTVQITLREFFDAISTGKNLHQSWKKPIYKNIAKLDQLLPEFFKDTNWMMELAKDENENMNS